MNQIFTLTQLIIGIVLTAIIAGGLGYLAGDSNLAARLAGKSPEAPAETDGTSIEDLDLTRPIIAVNYALDVSDQRPGNDVLVSKTDFARAAWVAVHEDKNGNPGNILGARLLSSGASENVTIELLRPTVSGIYYAMIHESDGDRSFDYASDRPLTYEGTPVMRRFVVGGSSEL